jgi:Ca-activated chloride channel homolog
MVFEWPQLLFGLALIPVLIGMYYFSQKRRRSYAVRFTNLDLLARVAGHGPGIRRHIPPLLYLCGAAALLTSLARPQAVIKIPRDQAAVILAIDVSTSMAASDLNPNRIEAAKKSAIKFVDSLPENLQVGLVSFNENALINVPLTRDHTQVRQGIMRLSTDGGTAIGEAIYLSLEQLSLRAQDPNGKPGPALIVLLSDGESNKGRSPVEAALDSAKAKIPIYTIGIGQRGSKIFLSNGIAVGLDENTLQEVASQTGGKYFYTAETEKLTQIYQDLSSQFAWVSERTEITVFASAAGTILILLGGFLSLRWFQQLP